MITDDKKKTKAPTVIEVLFKEQWRGHEAGTVVGLTAERASELIEGGTCEPTAELKAAELKAKVSAIQKAAVEAREAAKAGKAAAAKDQSSDVKDLKK